MNCGGSGRYLIGRDDSEFRARPSNGGTENARRSRLSHASVPRRRAGWNLLGTRAAVLTESDWTYFACGGFFCVGVLGVEIYLAIVMGFELILGIKIHRDG